MAFFACSRAGKTGTDKSTRRSIAKGTTSATYVNRKTGKTHLRGMVQADIVSNRNVSYVTSSSISSRVEAAIRASKAAGEPPAKRVAVAVKAAVAPNRASTKAPVISLHEGSPGTVETAKSVVIPKKGLMVAVIAVAVVLFIGNKVL